MAEQSSDFSGASSKMIERKKCFEELFQNNPEFSFGRLKRNNGKDIEISYRDEVICVVQDVNLIDCYCAIGARKIPKEECQQALTVEGGYRNDPEPETLFVRYRYRKGWNHPYTILVKDKEVMIKEINKIIKCRYGFDLAINNG